MILNGTDFGSVWQASGVTNFFGEGYWFHHLLKPIGLRWEGSTFVAKTTPVHPKAGNMPLREGTTQPRELRPKCIYINWHRELVGNAVALTSPGLKWLLAQGLWQERTEPFFLSFMPVADTPEGCLKECREFVEILGPELPKFKAKIGLQFNLTCPNVGHRVDILAEETEEKLLITSRLGLPQAAKTNVLLGMEGFARLQKCQNCHAIQVSNTLNWNSIPSEINKMETFGMEESPLKGYGGGGWSGAFMRPLVVRSVMDARTNGFKKPINAGGGLFRPEHLEPLKRAGVDGGVSLGSIAFMAPHRVAKTIRAGNLIWDGFSRV